MQKILEAISKMHLTPNGRVAGLLKMLTYSRAALFHMLHMTPMASAALPLNVIYYF